MSMFRVFEFRRPGEAALRLTEEEARELWAALSFLFDHRPLDKSAVSVYGVFLNVSRLSFEKP